MALTTAERTSIIKLVVAMFNAAPGATYLADLTVAYEANGRSLANLARDLANTTAYKNLNPVFQTDAEFATALLTPFGLQANTTAVDFVKAKFNAGLSKGQIAYDVAVALDATTDTQFADAKAILNNKTTVAEYYSVTKAVAQTNVATLQQSIATVTKDAASVTTAQTAIDNGSTGGSGSSVVLTTAADNLTGTSANDTFNGVVGTGATFSAADLINGGSGTDTLSLVTDANVTLIGSNLSSIEKIQANATAAAVVTFSNLTGVTEVVNNGSSAALTFGGGANASNVPRIVNLTVNGASAATTLSLTDTAVAGTADAITLSLSNTGSAATQQAVTIAATTAAANEVESLTINASGTNGITLTTDGTQTSLKTVTVTGAGALTLRLAADNIRTSATTINASAATGAVSIGADGAGQTLGAANHNVTLGTANDSVFFGANLNSSDTVDGGTGTDTLGVSAALTNAIMTNVKGFETVRFDISGASVTQDAGITSLAGLGFAVTGANTLTLNNLANGATTTIVGTTTTLTEVLKDGSGLTDALTVGIQSTAAATLTTLTQIAGLETLNLSSGTGTNTHTITTDSVTAAHVVTGAAPLTITNALATTSFNATALTGKLTVLAGNTATNIQSGTGADALVGGTAADTISGGAGNDTITNTVSGANTTAADVLAGGAGNDSFQLAGSAVATGTPTVSYALAPTITDFTVGTSASASDYVVIATNGTAYSAQVVQGTGGTNLTATAAGAVGVVSVAQTGTAALAAANQFIKLTTGVAAGATLQATFNSAIGTATLTGGTAGTVMVGSLYDTTNSKAVIFEVNTTNGTNTVVESGDVIRIIGTVNMTATDYAAFGTNNIALVNF